MSKLDEMYTALAPAKKDGYPVTQIAYDELQSALVTANERIREWSDKAVEFSTIASRYEEELAAEREVSDKLEKALNDALRSMQVSSYHPCKTVPMNIMEDALAKVAAIRKGEPS